MTEKRRSIASKLLILVVMLTLISFCFLGSTFARYTSGGNGTATMQVAKWDVSIEPVATTTITTNKISPSMLDYTANGNVARTHGTGAIAVATITNSSDVDAKITLDVGDIQLPGELTGKFGTGMKEAKAPTDAEVKAVFSYKLTYDLGERKGQAWPEGGVTLEAGDGAEALTIYMEIIWTSDTGEITGTLADQRDTWIGQYVKSVSYTLTYTAVQASELPSNP